MAKAKKKAAKPAKKAKAKTPARKVAAKKAAPKKSGLSKAVARVTATISKIAGGNGAKKNRNGNGLPKLSSKPFGQAGKALQGVRILDFTHVQSGPTCTQLLAYMGADCIKVERPGVGDITRGQLQDIPKVDSLYFTMLNHNKRSITLDTRTRRARKSSPR